MTNQVFENTNPSRLSIRLFSPKIVHEGTFGLRSESRVSHFSGFTLNLDVSNVEHQSKSAKLRKLDPLKKQPELNKSSLEFLESSPISSLPLTLNKKRLPDRMEVLDSKIYSKSMDTARDGDELNFLNLNDDADTTLTIDILTESGCTSRFSQFPDSTTPRELSSCNFTQKTPSVRTKFSSISTESSAENLCIKSKKQSLQCRSNPSKPKVPPNTKLQFNCNKKELKKTQVNSIRETKIIKKESFEDVKVSEPLHIEEKIDKLDTINESLRELNYTSAILHTKSEENQLVEATKASSKIVPKKLIPKEPKIVLKVPSKTCKQNKTLNMNLFMPVADKKLCLQEVSKIVPKIILSSASKPSQKPNNLKKFFKERSKSTCVSKIEDPPTQVSLATPHELPNSKPLSPKINVVEDKKVVETEEKILLIENPFSKPLKRADSESQPIIYDMFGNAQHPYESVITSLNENKPQEKPTTIRNTSASKPTKTKTTSAKMKKLSKNLKISKKVLISKNEMKMGDEQLSSKITFKASDLEFMNSSSPTISIIDDLNNFDDDFIESDSSSNDKDDDIHKPLVVEVPTVEQLKNTSVNSKSNIRELYTIISKNDSIKSVSSQVVNRNESPQDYYYNVTSHVKKIYDIPPVLSTLINTLQIHENKKTTSLRQTHVSLDSNGNSDYTLSTSDSSKKSDVTNEEPLNENVKSDKRQFSVVAGGFGDEFPYKWRRGEMLGKGAFGIVYAAFLLNLGSIIAVKQVEMDEEDPQEALKEYNNLKEEIIILKELDHINIVKFLGTSLTGNIVNIFMENISGGTIESLLKIYGAFEEDLLRKFTTQIVEGVHYIHQHNVVHRDIKGKNIMLMTNGVIKLIDFGCAKRLKSKNQSLSNNTQILKSFKGTPSYMAPEVIRETGHGPKADIWSIGATVFEMATGKPPWYELSPYAAIYAIGNDSTPIPSIPDNFSDDAKNFVNYCLNRDKDARPSASDLLEHRFLKNCD